MALTRFCFPLWLRTDFEGHVLWAYNIKHLDFLRDHIDAKLRERNGQELFNKSLGSRLPKWMTAKKQGNPSEENKGTAKQIAGQ